MTTNLIQAYRNRSEAVQRQLLAGFTRSEIVQSMRVSRAVVDREIARLKEVGALDETPSDEARVEREIASGKRCGCGLLKPHDFLQRLTSCTLVLLAMVLGSGCGVISDMVNSEDPGIPIQHGPATVWLRYADGVTPADPGTLYPGLVPPAANCDRACKDAMLAGLHARFGDLAVDFVEDRPAGPHYTEVLSSGGDAWTPDGHAGRGGVSPWWCQGYPNGTSFVFMVGDVDDNTLAVMVAHEIGHLFGLEHTANDVTLMGPYASAGGQSFGNAETVDDQCNRPIQDEPAMLAAMLGYRP
jgi:hypothetical protein